MRGQTNIQPLGGPEQAWGLGVLRVLHLQAGALAGPWRLGPWLVCRQGCGCMHMAPALARGPSDVQTELGVSSTSGECVTSLQEVSALKDSILQEG